jgi:outer membrane protein assembly factor BamB
MKAILPTAAALLLLLAPCRLLSQEKLIDWAQFRGPGGLAVSAAKGLPTTWSESENLAWKTKLPGPGTSSPIVFGDRIYLTCYSGYNVPGERGKPENLKRHLVCLSRKDGKVVWDKAVKAELPEQDRIRDDHGYASNTPAADKDHVYCFYGRSGVYAFTHEGKQAWQADVGTKLSGWGSAASPVLHGDLVIVNASVESECLVALDRKTGKEKWRAKGIKESWNTPLFVPVGNDRTEIVLAIFGKVLGFDPADGKQLWSCATDIGWYVVPSLVAHDGVVYCVAGRGDGSGALAVRAGGSGDVTESRRLWKINKGSNVTSPIYHDGHLYWMHEGLGIAYCVEAKSGDVVYQERVGRLGEVYASPVLADGKIYYTSRGGQTLVVAAKPKYQRLATNDLRDRSLFHGSPAVTGGRLLIRSDKYLYCLEKK